MATFENLRDSVESSYKRLEGARERLMALRKQYVGRNYSEGGSARHVPVNLLELAVTSYTHLLAPKAPQVSVKTNYRELRISADYLEMALNELVRRNQFD